MMKNNKYIEGYDNFCLSGGLCGYPLEKSMILDRFDNTKAEGPSNYAMHQDTQFEGQNWKYGIENTPEIIEHCKADICNPWKKDFNNIANTTFFNPKNLRVKNSSSCNGCHVCQTTTCDPSSYSPEKDGLIKLPAICENCHLNIPIINQPTTMKQ